jgi:hypothetical protein
MGGLISRLFLAEIGVKGKESSRLSQNKSNLIFEKLIVKMADEGEIENFIEKFIKFVYLTFKSKI